MSPVNLSIAFLLLFSTSIEEAFVDFSRSPARGHGEFHVRIGNLIDESGDRHFWFRILKVDEGRKVMWTDTRRCPKARSVVNSLSAVPPPQITVPGQDIRPDGTVIVTADGVGYQIKTSGHYDGNIGSDLSFSSNSGTPLASWVEGSLKVLEPCWSDAKP